VSEALYCNVINRLFEKFLSRSEILWEDAPCEGDLGQVFAEVAEIEGNFSLSLRWYYVPVLIQRFLRGRLRRCESIQVR